MRVLVLAAALLLAAAAPAGAAKVTYGSDLSLPANLADSNAQDWMAWPVATTPASAGGYTVPTQGEVAAVAFRGQIDAGRGIPTLFVARVLVLRPQPDGRVKVMVASTDLAPKLANVGADAVTTIDLQQFPERMCALPGDVVALATSGGYDAQTYPTGVPVQMFSRTPDSVTNVFKVQPGGDTITNDDVVAPTRTPGVELLMRTTIGTGDDARPTCRSATPPPTGTPTPAPEPGPGGTPTPAPTTGPTSSPVTLPKKKSAKVRRKRVKLPVRCDGPSPCTGRLALSRKSKPFGSAPFALTAGQTERVSVKLPASARRALKRVDTGLTIKVVATTATGLRVTRRTILRR